MKPQNHNKGLFYHPSPRQLRGGSLIDDSGVNYGKDTSTKNLKASSDFADQHKTALSDVDMEIPTLKSGSKKDRDLYRNQMAIYNKKVKDKEKGFKQQYKSEIMGNLDNQFLQAGYTKDKNGKWTKPASISDVPFLDKAIGWIPGATDFANRAISAGEKVYNKPNLENIMNAGQTLADSAMSGYNMGKQLADPKKLIKDIAIQQGKKALGMGFPRNYSNVDNHYNGHKKRKLQGRGAGGAPKKINKITIIEKKEEKKEDDEEEEEDNDESYSLKGYWETDEKFIIKDADKVSYEDKIKILEKEKDALEKSKELDDALKLTIIDDELIKEKENLINTELGTNLLEMIKFPSEKSNNFVKEIFYKYFTSLDVKTDEIKKFLKDPKNYLEENSKKISKLTDINDTNLKNIIKKIKPLKDEKTAVTQPVITQSVVITQSETINKIAFFKRSNNQIDRNIKDLENEKNSEKNKIKREKLETKIKLLNEEKKVNQEKILILEKGDILVEKATEKTAEERKDQLLKEAKQIIIGRDLKNENIRDGDTFESKLIKVLPAINNSLKKVENTKEIFKYKKHTGEEILATGAPFDFADIHDNKLKVIGEIKYGVTPEWEVYYDSQIQINNKIDNRGGILAGTEIKSPVSGLKLQTSKFEGYDTYKNDAGETINDHWKILGDLREGNAIIKTISFNNPNYGMSQIKDNLEISQYLLYAEMYDNEDSKNKSLYVCNLLKTNMFDIMPGGKMKVKDEYKYKLPKPQEDDYDNDDDYLIAQATYLRSKDPKLCYVPFKKFTKVNKLKK